MKVGIICVNYNSYKEAKAYLGSINRSLQASNSLALDVVFVDNSEQLHADLEKKSIQNGTYDFGFHFVENDNNGYFQGFVSGIRKSDIDLKEYDYLILSNVDLELSEGFFNELISLKKDINIGIIAPSILSRRNGRDINPKIVNRPSSRKMSLYTLIYSYSIFYKVWMLAAKIKNHFKSKRKHIERASKIIYAPHGSFVILTKKFLDKCNKLDYPMFLFGEEIYFAEESRLNHLLVYYYPSLIVYDYEHCSTSKQNTRFLRMHNLKSINYLKQRYFVDN